MRRHFLQLLFVCATTCGLVGPSSGAPPEKAVAEELKRLDGDWKIVAAEQGGAAVESGDLVTFSGGKCTVTNPATKIVLENTFSIDPSQTPKRIEVTNTKTQKTWAGIYELNGDTLRCLFYGGKDAQVPTEFKTAKGGPEVMYTYERVKTK
jgi:uncharacterized protein (TIGR03067 family)